MSKFDSVVSLNVGGHIYTTARSTLTRFRDSMLGAMFGGNLDTLRDDQGRYFIDRDGRLFQHVLNFLRTSQLVLPEDFKELPLLEMEADFYQIQPLTEALKNYKARLETGPCEVVILIVQAPGSLSVAASSAEVKDLVNGMIGTLTGVFGIYVDDHIAAILRRLQDTGFTVQSHTTTTVTTATTTSIESTQSLTDKWVLVRKSPNSK